MFEGLPLHKNQADAGLAAKVHPQGEVAAIQRSALANDFAGLPRGAVVLDIYRHDVSPPHQVIFSSLVKTLKPENVSWGTTFFQQIGLLVPSSTGPEIRH